MSDQVGGTVPKQLRGAFDVLMALEAHPKGSSLSHLARQLEVPLTSAHRTMGALVAVGLVRETTQGLYALGPACLRLGNAYLAGLDLRVEALPHMRQLSSETGETCHLGILDGTRVVYIEKVDSPGPIRMVSQVGGTNPATRTALGKAILAHMPTDTVAALVDKVGEEDSAIDYETLSAELDQVRAQGFSVDDEEVEAGIRCRGAAVLDHTDTVVAAISVSSVASRVDEEDLAFIAKCVRAAALRLSELLGYVGGTPDEEELN